MLDNFLKYHPSIQRSQDIYDICAPLKKLNISYFAHVKISHDKQFSAISSHPQFMEHYLKNKFYSSDIHMVDEKKFGNCFVWDGIEFSGESGRMCSEAGEFGIHNPFTMIERNAEGIEYFHFANATRNKQINQVYLANIDLLHAFINYFKTNVNQDKDLVKAYKFKIDIQSYPQTTFEDQTIVYDKHEFMNEIELNKTNSRIKIDNIMLSKRQTDVLHLFLRGQTIKEISKILHLSPRTTGHYLETIKTKLNVTKRSDLFAKTLDLPQMKLFGINK